MMRLSNSQFIAHVAHYFGCLGFHKTEQPFCQFDFHAPEARKGGKYEIIQIHADINVC